MIMSNNFFYRRISFVLFFLLIFCSGLKAYNKALNRKALVFLNGVVKGDFKGWQQGLAKKKNVEFKFYPDLNHLFIKGTGRSSPSEYAKGGNVNRKVVADISDWILKIVK